VEDISQSAPKNYGNIGHTETVADKHAGGAYRSFRVACGVDDLHTHQTGVPTTVRGQDIDLSLIISVPPKGYDGEE